MRALTLAFCLLAATACTEKSPAAPSPVDQRVVLAPGQSAFVSEARLTVQFEGVVGDSRCPADAVCVLGGDAIVRLRVTAAGGSARTHELHTGDMKPVQHDDVTIALVELSPYPFSARQIQPDEYRATLRISR